MTKKELENLKVGDMCAIIRGNDVGRIAQIAYIEEGSVLIRSVDGEPFRSQYAYGKFRLTGWRELKPLEQKEEEN